MLKSCKINVYGLQKPPFISLQRERKQRFEIRFRGFYIRHKTVKPEDAKNKIELTSTIFEIIKKQKWNNKRQ